MFVNLFKYCEANGLDVFKYLPFTIIIQYESPNYLVLMENFTKLFNNMKDFVGYSSSGIKGGLKTEKRYASLFSIAQMDKLGLKTNVCINPSHFDGKNIWLIKAPDLNRGRCIKIGNNLQNIQKLIKKFYDGIMRDFKQSEEEENKEQIKFQSKTKDEGKFFIKIF